MADAKEMWEAIKSRFGGNDESKKMKKYLLKQQFEGFSGSTSEGLHKGYDRFQTLLSQLDIRGAGVSHEDVNQKFLRPLPSSWSQVALIMKTKPGLDTLSFDDLYNNLRVFNRDVKGTTASSSNTQNVAFVSADNTSSTNDINDDDMEEMDLKWQDDSKALVTIDGEDIDWSGHVEEDAHNYAMMAYSFSNSHSDNKSVFMNKESDLENTSVNDRYAGGMHAVPPPMTGNYMPSGPNVEIDYSKFTYGLKQTSVDELDSKPSEYASCESDSSVETTTFMPDPVDNAPKVICEPKVWTDAAIIEEYESNSDNDSVSNVQEDKEKPSFAFTDSIKHVKTFREIVKETGTPNHSPNIRKQGRNGHTRKGDDPRKALKDKGIIDSGCSRHMTGNKAHLADYQEFKGGPIDFGGSNGRITGKGKIKAGKLDFEDLYYVEELKHYNLFSVSQMYDKKNKVLFTDTDCLVLSPDFKLLDENQVLLKSPRQHNMYDFNLKIIDPSRDLACLFAKASIDESINWHRRLGHVNFKNINKLVKRNLVTGLPFKIFENDHTCVACQKGKQHKASCKAKIASFVNQPLYSVHVDLFRPTSIRSINHKTNCLVITDGFSKFSWVYFLKSKDETTPILMDFIRQAENQFNQKVKTIRSDNETEFKNNDLIEFCWLKGIKKEYSYARTLQQNGVAKRKNKTLIEAAKTMLADSFLPTTFWAKPVNTTCYVLNRAFRVYNLETKRIKENLYVNFLENKPNVAGKRHAWMFVLGYLTNSMNYKPVLVENQANKSAGPKEANNSVGKEANDAARKETTYENQNAHTNSTNLPNTISIPLSAAAPLRAFNDGEPSYPDDPLMPHLEDIYASPSEGIFTDLSYDNEGMVTDFNNLETNVNVSPTPTTRIHTIHPKTQILGDPMLDVKTRSKVNKNSKAHALKAIGTKWVYRNKKDERGVVVRNKSAFLYGTIDEEVYVTQPPGFVDLSFLIRSMIRSLMYLTASRPNIMFAVFACPRFQYPKVSSFDLEAYSDSDYAGVNLNRKSTTRGCQFLGMRLISWQYKKQTIVATSTTEAEYVAAAHCSIATIVKKRLLEFWASTTIKKVNDIVKLRALIDGKRVVVTEDVIRQDLRLNDVDGVECLPNEEIFKEIARMGYEKPPPNLTFYKDFFSAQWKFLIHTLVQCISAKRTTWNKFSCSMASTVICLATCKKFNFSKYIFNSMVRNVDSPSKFLMYPQFLQVIINAQVDDLSSHTNQYTSPALTQKAAEEENDVEVPAAPTSPSLTPPTHDPIPTPPQAQPDPPSSPPHKQQTDTTESSMTLSNTLMKVKKLEKKRISKSYGLKRLRKVGAFQRVKSSTETVMERIEDASAATKEINATEPTMFDDEEVTMTMAQTLIKMKAKKARLLDEQIAKRLHDEEVEQAAAKEKQENDDLEKAKVLQKHLKRKPISIAQARKNMIIYLKNMAGYKMEHFRGMTYDKVRPIFERECNKVQTLFKPDKDVEEPQKKIVAKETLLQESFKKLKGVEVSSSHSTQDTLTNDPKEMSEEDVKNMLEIVLVSEFKVEALQVKEDLDALWRLVKEKFSSVVPTVDKEKALWVELTRLFKLNADDVFCQQTKEKKFGYILQVIKKLKLKKLDCLLGATQHVALDNSLVAPEKRLKIKKCNARIAFSKPQSEKHIKSLWKLSSYLLAIQHSRLLLKNLAILEDFMYQAGNREISLARKEHMPYPKFTKVIISHFIFKDKTISMRNTLKLHTIRDGSLLGTLMFVSKIEDSQKHGALIPDDMINQDIKDSKDYKTYYDFATGKVSPKKANKFKKIASPSRKLFPVKEADSVKKDKSVKRPAKKSTTTPTAVVVIRDTLVVSISKKKAPAKGDRVKVIELLSDVHDESEDKTTGTDEETGIKPGVPSNKFDSDNESWGDSEDESDDINDDDNANYDESENEDDDGNGAHDSERTDLDDDDKNPSFTLKDYDEEEHDEEYESNDAYENVYEEEDVDLYKDVEARSLRAEHEKERKGDEEDD
nr:putative ribonuclease H-like domain-containing protein [Tanacetum cinerariifolium]